jgi:signal transduction histidine kinase
MSDSTTVKILLVDDQPARLLSYEAILSELGYEIVKASSGSEALQLLMHGEIAVILLDVNMPVMDGFETAALIHQHPRYEKTPIIFVTAFQVSEMDRLRAYALGAIDYVLVPVIPQILRSKVAVLVELYTKRRELALLNSSLAAANAELAATNSNLQVEKTRELAALNGTLESANAELARANATLTAEITERKRLESELKETDRRKDQFLAMLAHELRNPLAPIVNGLEVMRLKKTEDAELIWCREAIGRQVSHLTRLVDDLLDVARITQGKIKLKLERLEIVHVIARAVEIGRPAIDTHGHTLTVSLPEGSLFVDGDLTRLAQAIGNLLINAAKYTPERGRIDLRVENKAGDSVDQSDVEIRVQDNGIGVPREMLPRLFSLFSQLDDSADRTQGGLGVGLALVRRVVELHDGVVSAHSEGPGRGSTFVIRLPLALTPLYEPVSLQEPAQAAKRSPRKVLVVDDAPDSAHSLAMLLRVEGHEVRAANDGPAALDIAAEWHPDVIVLDLGMPGMDGYETAARIRASSWGKEMVLVALTGWGETSARDRTRRLGFATHLIKPVERATLLNMLETCTAASS